MKHWKHLILPLCALALAVLAAGCRGEARPLISLEQEQGATSLWYYDGACVVRRDLSQEDAAALLDRLNSLSAAPAESFEASSVQSVPLYGLCIDQGEYDFEAVVCAGVWQDSAGGMRTLEEDFGAIWSAFTGEEAPATLTDFPHIRALAQSGEGWNAAFLEPGVLDPPRTDLLQLSVVRWDEESRELRVSLENHDLTTYSTSCWSYDLQVWTDGEWYAVPYATNEHVTFPSEAWDVTRHLGQSFTLHLEPYGALPAGTYRVVKVVSNIYGLAPDASVTAEFTL